MSRLVKSAVILFIATAISKVIGFIRDIIVAYVYGAGVISDSYLMALNIMTVAFISLLCVAIQSTYMPVYTNVETEEGHEGALKFSSNVINIIIIISLIISILGWFFTVPLVKIFAIGFEGERLALTVQLTRIILFSVGAICVTYVLKAYLEIYNYFLITGLMPLTYNVAIIIAVLLSEKLGVQMLAYGTLIAFFIQMLFLVPFCIKKGFKYKFVVNLSDKNLKRMFLGILPIFVGASADQLNSLVDKNLASFLIAGSMSALNYAFKLNVFVSGLFVASITSVIYPLFSKLGAERKIEQLKVSFCKSINSVILLTMPMAVGAFILAEPIIRVLFERGAFDHQATHMTASVLACYSIGMVAAGMRDVTVRVFYSLEDTKIPMRNSVICVIFNIICNLILIRYLKIAGLALASSISAILAACFLIYNLRKKIGKLNATIILQTLLKTFLAAAVMSVAVLFAYGKLNLIIKEKLALLISVIIGAVVYGVSVIVLKVDSIDYVLNILKHGKAKLGKIR